MMRHFTVLLTLLLLATAAFGASPETLFTSGKQAMANGDVEKAVSLFEQAVNARPNSSEYHYMLGSAYGRLAQRSNMFKAASLAKKALASLEKAVALDPNNLDARFGLISYYKVAPGFMGGDDAKALTQAAEVKKRDPLLGHRAFAMVYTFDKKPDLARKEHLDAIGEHPESAKAHHYYGMFLSNEKKFDEAAKEFETAAAMDFMPAHFRLAMISVLSKRDYARGEQALKKYLGHTPLASEPTIADAWFVLGQIYEQQGRKVEARQSYSNVLKLQPGSKAAAEAMKRVS
jgi:Tfp pilus assembly protein PilF